MTKHSEGPWFAERNCINTIDIISADGDHKVAELICEENDDEVTSQMVADAILIKEAPNMLGVLTIVQKFIEGELIANALVAPDVTLMGTITAAIAKATDQEGVTDNAS